MRIFTTLEEAKRLKEAGFLQGKSEYLLTYGFDEKTLHYVTRDSQWGGIAAPSAAEIMEEMGDEINTISYNRITTNWMVDLNDASFCQDKDLLTALVEAYCKTMGEK